MSDDAVGNLDNLDTLTTALANNDALVREFTKEVADATELLDDEHESMESTFDALSAMVREVTTFSHDHRAEIATRSRTCSRSCRRWSMSTEDWNVSCRPSR